MYMFDNPYTAQVLIPVDKEIIGAKLRDIHMVFSPTGEPRAEVTWDEGYLDDNGDFLVSSSKNAICEGLEFVITMSQPIPPDTSSMKAQLDRIFAYLVAKGEIRIGSTS